MDSGDNGIVQYRLERAEETYLEALLLAANMKWKGSLNRLYYACFYAVIALLAKFNIQAHTHNGAKTQFHKAFIANGLFSKESGLIFNRLFSARQFGDYDDFYEIDAEYINKYIPLVRVFIDEVKDLIEGQDPDFISNHKKSS